MKKLLVFIAFFLSASCMSGQALNAENLLSALTIKAGKLDDWLAKKKYFFSNTGKAGDTVLRFYQYKPEVKKNKPVDSVKRSIIKKDTKEDFTLTYQTSSNSEFATIKTELKTAGFYCNQDDEPGNTTPLLYQNRDITVALCSETKDSTTTFSLLLYKKTFPDPADINYADDLLCFTSHEYLVHYFGAENVKKDIYYFSGNELAKCSVLFVNTARQVVFIWKDEMNRRGITSLLFGGQQKLKSLIDSDKFIAESNWIFKSGIYAGMPLYELRTLNGGNLKFYGANAVNAGTVVADNNGKLDFKKQEVLLSCMNCTERKFASAPFINSDEVLNEGKILFVLSVIFTPDSNAVRSGNAASPGVVTK